MANGRRVVIAFDPDPELEMAVGLDNVIVFTPYLTLAGEDDGNGCEPEYDDAA